jgi:hypothetical protein
VLNVSHQEASHNLTMPWLPCSGGDSILIQFLRDSGKTHSLAPHGFASKRANQFKSLLLSVTLSKGFSSLTATFLASYTGSGSFELKNDTGLIEF